MIPRGRPALTEADIAALRTKTLKAWQRTEGDALPARVPLVNLGGCPRLYDEEQVHAHLRGAPRPPGSGAVATGEGADGGTSRPAAVPPGEEHPDDLLTDQEAAFVLETRASTVRDYAANGYLPVVQRHGRTWFRRADLDARRGAGDQRQNPHLTGAGRPKGARTGSPPPTGSPRGGDRRRPCASCQRRGHAAHHC